jgi:hypothetical protein
MVARVYSPSHPSHLHTFNEIKEKRCEGGCEQGVKLTDRVGSIQSGGAWVTGDGMARRVVEVAHARAMAEEARALAAQCRPDPAFRLPVGYDPEAAVRAAEGLARRVVHQRVVRADKLAGLRDAGKITPIEFRAGQEIRLVVEYLDGGRVPMVRSQFAERLASGSDGTGELMVIEEAERERFGPWRAWARRLPARRLPRRSDETIEDLTRLVVVKGRGVQQVADALAIDRRNALARLRQSLGWYVERAGWVGGENTRLTSHPVSML